MRQLIIQVPDELSASELENTANRELLNNVKKDVEELNSVLQGKRKSRPASELIKELHEI
ncbi:MAG: hypothetical protein LBQ65_02035 [Tannerellaceae bacterium]|jgi:hypothetical protein|nr:hypothetical protein [Tannerellaceae bacterium]